MGVWLETSAESISWANFRGHENKSLKASDCLSPVKAGPKPDSPSDSVAKMARVSVSGMLSGTVNRSPKLYRRLCHCRPYQEKWRRDWLQCCCSLFTHPFLVIPIPNSNCGKFEANKLEILSFEAAWQCRRSENCPVPAPVPCNESSPYIDPRKSTGKKTNEWTLHPQASASSSPESISARAMHGLSDSLTACPSCNENANRQTELKERNSTGVRVRLTVSTAGLPWAMEWKLDDIFLITKDQRQQLRSETSVGCLVNLVNLFFIFCLGNHVSQVSRSVLKNIMHFLVGLGQESRSELNKK